MAQKFVIGDIVELKSGGPKMAVNNYNNDNQHYKCQWFAGKKLEQGFFPEESLEKAQKSTP